MLTKSRQVLIMMKLDFEETKVPVKVTNIDKIIYRHPIYVSKTCCEENYVDFILIGEEEKDFNPFMYDHTLNCGSKRFRCYCLQVSSTEKTLKGHVENCCKIYVEERIEMPKNGKYPKVPLNLPTM